MLCTVSVVAAPRVPDVERRVDTAAGAESDLGIAALIEYLIQGEGGLTVAKGSPSVRAWNEAFKPACRARKMRFVGWEGFVVDEVYIAAVQGRVAHPHRDTDRLRITWTFTIKPMAVDEILWAAFMPEVTMGPQMRINRRINGAFQVQPLRMDTGWQDVAATEQPDWEPVLDRFENTLDGFIKDYPSVTDYVTALQRMPDGIASNRDVTRLVTALMAAGRSEDAAQLAQQAIDAGESGSMFGKVDVLKYLAAYAEGPQAYAEFQATLAPTHDYQVVCETRSGISSQLMRAHHRGVISRHVASLNGSDPWAVVLSARPPASGPADWSTSLYLQAAGTAEAMVVEFCQPGGAEIGAVSVRSVVGHRQDGPTGPDVEIVLPRSTQTIAAHEVFTADEAAHMFEIFYRTDTVGEQYTLRWVEGYTAEGGLVRPD